MPIIANKTPLIRYTLSEKTELFRMGAPFPTDATVLKPSGQGEAVKNVPVFDLEISKTGTVRLDLKLAENDAIYGLGESLGRVNKRGGKYRLYAKDDLLHTPDKISLYGSHPFAIIAGKETVGIFIDYPGKINIDAGFLDKDKLSIEVPTSDIDIYIFKGGNAKEIVKEFLTLVGPPCLPPKWAFGYQQSRYSYQSADAVRDVAKKMRKNNIPCDVIYLDIHYMDACKVFTIDTKNFPDFPQFVKELAADGFKLIPIVDPGVRIEEGYEPYESGLKRKAFCVDKDGEEFVGAVWPGLVHFPDYLNQESRDWWGEQYKPLVDAGLHAFWNDMNEPSIFYTPESLDQLRETVASIDGIYDLGVGGPDFHERLTKYWVSEDFFEKFYHRTDDGKLVKHTEVHNLYGTSMAKATAEGMEKFRPGMRQFVVSRSSYIGHHRHSVIWTGDNHSWWEHMIVQMRMLVSCNLVGLFYLGADVGGFSSDTSPELLVRWTQLGIFSPFFRNHSFLGTRNQEPWQFDDEVLEHTKNAIRLRYALLPYLYSEFIRSVKTLEPYISGLFYHYETPESKGIDDQLMIGQSLMVAPIHEANARGRYVHLPGQRWLMWLVKDWETRNAMKVFEPGNYFIETKLSEIPMFIKENSLISLTEPGDFVGQRDIDELTFVGFVSDKASYTLYDDDGETLKYKEGQSAVLEISVVSDSSGFKIDAKRQEINIQRGKITLNFEIYDQNGKKHSSKLKI